MYGARHSCPHCWDQAIPERCQFFTFPWETPQQWGDPDVDEEAATTPTPPIGGTEDAD